MSAMNIYTKRLHSFRHKRRPSTTSTAAANPPPSQPTKWPHDRPSPKTLAAAGLYYNPSAGHPDNVTCYLCGKDLDGWEPDDDPVGEHAKHCPDCGWAQVSVAAEVAVAVAEDPRGARMVRARADTFGDWWPHEAKAGWVPSVHRMAEAGWHYAPTKDMDDFASCAYCGLSLDGWEPDDDPVEEHRRRTPHCPFFTWTPPPRQPTRKAPRASLVMAPSDDDVRPTATKKPAMSRAKRSKRAEPEPEPVDNVFEDAPPRGRKRASTAAPPTEEEQEDAGHEQQQQQQQQQQPALKKRATRASLAAQQLSRDAKMTAAAAAAADSDNDSLASAASRAGAKGKTRTKAKKPAAAARRTSRGVRKTKAPIATTIPSDDELDRALALDLERPLTDEEEGFKDFKQPFIRPMKRLTRSRASLAVEERMRNAPPDTLLGSTAKRGRSRTPAAADAVERSPTKSPSKRFFRESSQDFSFPVRVPRHLAVEDDVPEVEDGFAGDTIKVAASRDMAATDTEMEMEIQVKPRKGRAPAKKAPGRKKKKGGATETVTATEDEPAEAPKPKKRGKAAKKAAAPTRESNVTVDSVQEKIELQLHQEQEERPQKGRKRLVRGTRPKRESAVSAASTVEPEPAQSFMDIDHHHEQEPAEASDAGSVVRHEVADTLYPTLAPSPEPHAAEAEAEAETAAEAGVEMEEADPTPKPAKKTADPAAAMRPTRSSAVSTASTTASSIAGSHLNSDSDNTPRQRARKPTKKQQQQQQARLRRAKADALKKGSESFFSSAQNEEMAGRRGRRTHSSMTDADAAEEDSVRDSTSAAGEDVPMADEEQALSGNNSDGDGDGDGLSATDIDPPSSASSPAPATDTERPLSPPHQHQHQHQHAPAAGPTSAPKTRMPLSPVRRGMNIPLTTTTTTAAAATTATTTPKAHAKATAAAPYSRKPWVAVDLDTVFAHGSDTSDEGAGVLSAREREMTVAEWVKWNAAQAEARMGAEGERIVALFEACGRRAREAIEAIETVD